jgi:hypothetical protein
MGDENPSFFIGSLIFGASCYFLYRNSSIIIERHKEIDPILKRTKNLNIENYETVPDGEPVYISKRIRTKEVLRDDYGVKFMENTPCILRKIQTFQNNSWTASNDSDQLFTCNQIFLGRMKFDKNFISKYLKPVFYYNLKKTDCEEVKLPWLDDKNSSADPSLNSDPEKKFKTLRNLSLGLVSNNSNSEGDLLITYFTPKKLEYESNLTVWGAKKGDTIVEYEDARCLEKDNTFKKRFFVFDGKLDIEDALSRIGNMGNEVEQAICTVSLISIAVSLHLMFGIFNPPEKKRR